MSVTIGSTVYGCDAALEKQAYGLRNAGEALSAILAAGGTLPATWTEKGQVYAVVKANVSTPNGSTDNQTQLAAALSASRGGVKTILVLAPSAPPNTYRYSNSLNLSANTYLTAYGATLMPLNYINTAIMFQGANSGVIGGRFIGRHETMSKWPERFTDTPDGAGDPNKPAKNGSIATNNGGGVTDDAWFVTGGTGRNRIIILDNICNGSLTGMVRCWGSGNVDPGPTQHLYENNVMRRSHSDSIHITNNSTYMTCRKNRIYDGGDDCISVVSYKKVDNPPPGNILVELNEIRESRARGLTVIGGFNVLHQDNYVENTVLAPFYYNATSAHQTYSISAVCRRNRIYRGGKRESAHGNGNYAVMVLENTTTGESVTLDCHSNEADSYGEWYATAGNPFVRDGGGNTTVTQSGAANVHRQIVSST